MTSRTHPTDLVLGSYARAPREVDSATADVVESHLTSCGRCRTVVGDLVSSAMLARSWSGVVAQIGTEPTAIPVSDVAVRSNGRDPHRVPAQLDLEITRTRQPRRWRVAAAAAVVLILAAGIYSGTRSSEPAVTASRGPGWVDILSADASVHQGASPAVSAVAVTEWGDRLLVVTANEGSGSTAWLTDGDGWERRELDIPVGCDLWGGLVVSGDALAVGCTSVDEAERFGVFVATTTDLEVWEQHPVAPMGSPFGAWIGPAPDGGVTVAVLEAADVNTTRGATVRVWTTPDVDTNSWRESTVTTSDTFVDAALQSIDVVGDDIVITGSLTVYGADEGSAAWRPSVWTSKDGGAFSRVELPAPVGDEPVDGWAFDLVGTPSGYAVVGGRSDGAEALGWTSTDLETWTTSTIGLEGSSDADQSMWSIGRADDGTLIAAGVRSETGEAKTWRSADDGVSWQVAGDGPEELGRWNGKVVGARSGVPLRVLEWDAASGESSAPASDGPEPLVLDVGALGEISPDSDAIITVPSAGSRESIFVLRDSSGELVAFSARAPKTGCRLALSSELMESGFESKYFDEDAMFHGLCHGEQFDRNGRKVGGPGLRDMYRYDIVPDDSRILVDTGLARPGASGYWGMVAELPFLRRGQFDDVARRWLVAAESAAIDLRGAEPFPFLWILGSFHDSSDDRVVLPFTMSESTSGHLEVGLAGTFPPDEDTGSTTRYDLDRGTFTVAIDRDSDPGMTRLIGTMDLPDDRRVRLEAIWPTSDAADMEYEQASIEDLVRFVDRTTAAGT